MSKLSINPLAHTGTQADNPPEIHIEKVDPKSTDVKLYNVGDLWLNTVLKKTFILAKIENNLAVWQLTSSSTSGAEVQKLTGNTGGAIPPDSTGNINIVGTGDITVTGAGNTLTIADSAGSGDISTLTGSSGGGAVSPNTSGNVTLEAGANITVTGVPASNKLTISSTAGGGGSISSFVVDSGGGGSYTTISSAITAAGALSSASRIIPIYIRGDNANTYTENLTMLPHLQLIGLNASNDKACVKIVGKITLPDTGSASFQNLDITNSGANNTIADVTVTGALEVDFDNCKINQTGTANAIELTGATGVSGTYRFTHSTVIATNQVAINSTGAQGKIDVASSNTSKITLANGTAHRYIRSVLTNTVGGGKGIELTSSAQVEVYNSEIISDQEGINIATGCTAIVYDTVIDTKTITTFAVIGAGTLEKAGLILCGTATKLDSSLTLKSCQATSISNYTVAKDGSGDFFKIGDAIAKAIADGVGGNIVAAIHIKPGLYQENTHNLVDGIHLIGTSNTGVILTNLGATSVLIVPPNGKAIVENVQFNVTYTAATPFISDTTTLTANTELECRNITLNMTSGNPRIAFFTQGSSFSETVTLDFSRTILGSGYLQANGGLNNLNVTVNNFVLTADQDTMASGKFNFNNCRGDTCYLWGGTSSGTASNCSFESAVGSVVRINSSTPSEMDSCIITKSGISNTINLKTGGTLTMKECSINASNSQAIFSGENSDSAGGLIKYSNLRFTGSNTNKGNFCTFQALPTVSIANNLTNFSVSLDGQSHYNAIQTAIDGAVNPSSTNPKTIIIKGDNDKAAAITYTGNITLKDGISLVASTVSGKSKFITIAGTITLPPSGKCAMKGFNVVAPAGGTNHALSNPTLTGTLEFDANDCVFDTTTNTGGRAVSLDSATAITARFNNCTFTSPTLDLYLNSQVTMSLKNGCRMEGAGSGLDLNGNSSLTSCGSFFTNEMTINGGTADFYSNISSTDAAPLVMTNTPTVKFFNSSIVSTGAGITIPTGANLEFNNTSLSVATGASALLGAGNVKLAQLNMTGAITGIASSLGTTDTVHADIMLLPRQYHFQARGAGAQNNVTGAGAIYTVQFGTVISQVGTGYNSGTGIFTAPVAGVYLFTATVGANNVTTLSNIFNLRFLLNGTTTYQGFEGHAANLQDNDNHIIATITTMINMTVGNTLAVQLTIDGNATDSIDILTGTGSDYLPVFTGRFLG